MGPAELAELLDDPLLPLLDDPDPEPDDVPPEPDELEDDPEDDVVVVRGTAWPARAGTANPITTRNVSERIDMVMAGSRSGTCSLTNLLKA